MRKTTRVSLDNLINENVKEIMSNQETINEIEKRIEKKHLEKAHLQRA